MKVLLCGIERERLSFLIDRDGFKETKEWAARTMRIYRKAVLKNGNDGSNPHFASSREYRRKFIEAYLHLKRFAT